MLKWTNKMKEFETVVKSSSSKMTGLRGLKVSFTRLLKNTEFITYVISS